MLLRLPEVFMLPFNGQPNIYTWIISVSIAKDTKHDTIPNANDYLADNLGKKGRRVLTYVLPSSFANSCVGNKVVAVCPARQRGKHEAVQASLVPPQK